jgi:tetratricopeptide (TPR) repeat protein
VAAALGLAVAGVLFGAGALGVGYVRTSQALHKSEESEQNARATVNDFFTVVSEDVLLNRPAMQPLRKELLDRALQHYREFLRERGDDPKLQAEIAATHYRIGRITELTDSYAAALPEYEQARLLQQQLLQREPGNDEYRQALGTTLNALGACLARLGQYSDSLAVLQDALRLREQSVRANAGDNERRRLLANTVMNVGNVLKSLGQFDDARDHLTQSLELRSPLLLPATPDNRKVRRDQGMAWFNLANLEIEIADPGDAQSWADRHGAAAGHLWESIRLFDAHARETPDDLELRALLMRAYRLLGEACVELDDLADAGQAYAAAEDLARDLTRENPRVPPLKLELASLLTMRGQLALERHDLDGAADWFRGSHEVLQALDADGALPAEGFGAFVTSLRLLATVYEEQQDWPRALESLESAQTALERFVAAAPFDAQLIEWLEDVRADLERVRALAARGQ